MQMFGIPISAIAATSKKKGWAPGLAKVQTRDEHCSVMWCVLEDS